MSAEDKRFIYLMETAERLIIYLMETAERLRKAGKSKQYIIGYTTALRDAARDAAPSEKTPNRVPPASEVRNAPDELSFSKPSEFPYTDDPIIAEVRKTIGALQYELPGSIWTDVRNTVERLVRAHENLQRQRE